MWSIFGFFTLFTFALYILVKRKENNWDATKYKYQDRYYLKGTQFAKKGFFIGCENTNDLKLNFSIKEKSNIDKFFKRVGLATECEVEDKKFNDKFYILSDDIRVCKLLKESKEIYDKFINMFELLKEENINIKSFFYKDNKMWLYIEDDEKFDKLEIILPQLFFINDTLNEKLASSTHLNTKDKFVFNASVLLSISSALLISGLLFFSLSNIYVIEKWALMKLSFFVGTIIVVLLCATALSQLGKSSRTHIVLLEFITVGYIGACTSSYYLLKKINIELDSSKEILINSKVLQKRAVHSRKSPDSYYVTLYNENGNKEYQIPYSIYQKLYQNEQVKVKVKKGFLGFRWIKDINKRF